MRCVACVALILVVLGCARKPPPNEGSIPAIVIQIEADPGLNPDGTGRPSPLVLRVYQLKDDSQLDSAQFFEIWNDDRAFLGGDLLWRQEVALPPSGSETVRAELASEARAIAVVGAYRDVRNSRWHAASPIKIDPKKPSKKIRFRVVAGARDLEMERSR